MHLFVKELYVYFSFHYITTFGCNVFHSSFVESCPTLSTLFLKFLQGMLYWYDVVGSGNPELTDCYEIRSSFSSIYL